MFDVCARQEQLHPKYHQQFYQSRMIKLRPMPSFLCQCEFIYLMNDIICYFKSSCHEEGEL